MSLLMEALRKAEQAKKQVAGAGSSPAPTQVIPEPQGEQVSPELRLSLETQDQPEGTSFGADKDVDVDLPGSVKIDPADGNQVRQDENGITGLEPANVSDPENVLELDDGMVDGMVVDTPASADLGGNSARDADLSVGYVLPVDPLVADGAPPVDVVNSGPEKEEARVCNAASAGPQTIASQASSRQTARTVFTAKKEYQRRSRNRRLRILGIVAGLALFAVGGFFFFTYRAMMSPALPVVVAEKSISGGGAEPESVIPTGEASLLSSDGVGEVGDVGSIMEPGLSSQDPKSVGEISPVPGEDSQPQGSSERASSHDTNFLPGATSLSPVSGPVATLAPSSPQVNKELPVPRKDESEAGLATDSLFEPENSSPAPIVISHRTAQPQVSSLLTAAYSAYQQGDFEQARHNYQLVLRADPQHRGALLGLASIAMHWQEDSLARDLYLRLLDQDPGDPLARSGLLAIAPTGDLVQQESELKLLLELHPSSAPLFFSLGNLYAAGQRWNEAQQAYFNALQAAKSAIVPSGRSSTIHGASDTGPGKRSEAETPALACVHPDYPFNLAVSLEHLGKLKAAANYYREALQCVADRPAGFDTDSLRARLKILEQGEAL